MKLIAREAVHGVRAGQTFEADASAACRLIAYGFASPADPGPADRAGFGTSVKRPQASDAVLAAKLRAKGDVEP